MGKAAAFGLLGAAYDRDLVSELGAFFGERVSVEGGRGWLKSCQHKGAYWWRVARTQPESSVMRNIKSFICVGVTSWSRRNTTPRCDTASYVSLAHIGPTSIGVPVIARSRILSSPHCNRSVTWRPSYSLPMMGVTSWCLKLSSDPE